jgi:26S proteasome regulatory subunit N1
MSSSKSKNPEEDKAVALSVTAKDADDKPKPEELSEEDQALKEGLELAVVRLQDEDDSLHKPALDHLVNEIRSATSSMTSVPKPLKFLRPHYDTIKAVYDSWPHPHTLKRSLADVLSVLAMTMAAPGSRESLRYKLSGNQQNISSWGHEYVRSLAGEISEEYAQRVLDSGEDEVECSDLLVLVDDILPFQMKHNAEAEAVDLLMEVRQLPKLLEPDIVDDRNFERVCLYLVRCAPYIPDPEDVDVLYQTAFHIYRQQSKYPDALRMALRANREDLVQEIFRAAEESNSDLARTVLKQMALILASDRAQVTLEDAELAELAGNVKLSEQFVGVAKEMNLAPPRHPEEVYKSVSENRRSALNGNNNSTGLDSAKGNLAMSIVNAFVNAAHCADKLVLVEGSSWVLGKHKAQGNGMLTAAASVGVLMLWNVEEGLNQIDKYFNEGEDGVKAGACLAVGICCNSVHNDADPALALLTDYIESSSTSSIVRVCAMLGLGIAYAGRRKEEVLALLESILVNTDYSIQESAVAAVALGLVYVGSCHEEVSTLILQRLMETSTADLEQPAARLLGLGLGLLFLGEGEKAEAVQEACRTIEHGSASKYIDVCVEVCAYAGTGNVLVVQKLLRLCAEHTASASSSSGAGGSAGATGSAPIAPAAGAANANASAAAAPAPTMENDYQLVAVLGIALIALGDEIATEMTIRTLEHLLQYSDVHIRRIVPLALALLYTSHPDYGIVDVLSRLTHDSDSELSIYAILALGIVSAGSNNSRIGNILRQLSDFYSKDNHAIFMIRIAQGLNALGKGLMTLSPLHSDRSVILHRYFQCMVYMQSFSLQTSSEQAQFGGSVDSVSFVLRHEVGSVGEAALHVLHVVLRDEASLSQHRRCQS